MANDLLTQVEETVQRLVLARAHQRRQRLFHAVGSVQLARSRARLTFRAAAHEPTRQASLHKGERFVNLTATHAPVQSPPLAPADDDEGYTTDDDLDFPPPLEDSDDYHLYGDRWAPPPKFQFGPRLLSQRLPTVLDDYDPSVTLGNADPFKADIDEQGHARRPRFGTEPRGGAFSSCCRCYCICSYCILTDGEATWAYVFYAHIPRPLLLTSRLRLQQAQLYPRDSPQLSLRDRDAPGALGRLPGSARLGLPGLSFFLMAASLNSCETRGSRRNTDIGIYYESTSTDLTSDRVIYPSQDGRRLTQRVFNIGVKRRCLEPSELEDAYGTWQPIPDDGPLQDDARLDLDGLGAVEGEEYVVDVAAGAKRKRYLSSDQPNYFWRQLRQSFLDETLRSEGLGDALQDLKCGRCSAKPPARFCRCTDCGTFIQCEACVRTHHATQPFHVLKEWNGHFWRRATLQGLKLVYQLGHGGLPCPRPEAVTRTMVVIHTNGLHTVDYRYCSCDLADRANNLQQLQRSEWYPATTVDPASCATYQCLDLYRMLNVVGNINVHDFVGSLERLTDATKITKLPDRYKAFGPPEFRFLYMLILALDANFRLKNRMRKNERYDPTFGPGWGYVVESKRYKKHLRSYIAEKDVCIIIISSLFRPSLTKSAEPRGWAEWCAHGTEVVRPQGIGDLQKGERYSNMDYIFLSAILGVMALWLAVSYDIACQWKVNLASRITKMPKRLQPAPELKMKFGLPVWHASAHENKCASANSLSYMPGAGKTDGEGIERTWKWGKEHGMMLLDDKIDHHNWEKNIGQGDTLARKLVVAIEERDCQVTAFEEEWLQKIEDWLGDPTKNPNPYEMDGSNNSGPSEATVRRELQKDELKEGADSVYRKGATAFLVAGMQLEQTQYAIKLELKGRTLLSGDQIGRVEELRVSLLAKLRTFRDLQTRHMPGAARRLEEEEEERDPDEPPPNPEDIKLWMPCELTQTEREKECAKGLAERESTLRVAQCTNALGYPTASPARQTPFDQVSKQQRLGERIDTIAAKYRRARAALVELEGGLYCEERGFRVLGDADIRLDEERESDGKARHRLAKIGSSKHRHANEPTVPSKHRTFSWIWTTVGGPEPDVQGLHEAVRIEWSKARARRDRWVEEVQLLREEMRRVMRFLQWQAAWWEGQRKARGTQIEPELAAGLEAYAARQAAIHRGIARRFKAAWGSSRSQVVRLSVLEDSRIFAEEEVMDDTSFVRARQVDGQEAEGGERCGG
ncbi:hypothetical protein C8F04DRAFT_1268392 [Mycena alexandri]|uniref:CxC2-like cysteine cluster KDZ transposase-associated domain-containing protein n=1 Tax=Mycena alexandri TaxID=1745969 RepID=A0AAD6SEL8_9AGAR|nr:hypothetical protein C8F04DRAFT_1268392 [Mycena alexandri]